MKPMRMIIAAIACLPTMIGFAQEPSAAQLKFFESHIRPALIKHCYECHSVDSGLSRGGLLLDSRQGWQQGGDGGRAIVPGKPVDSLLWQAITWDGYEMPPSGKMPADVIARFKQWIEMGAPDPRERKLLVHKTKISREDIEKGKEHWAFHSPRGLPDASIDDLVAEKLRVEGLKPAPPADAFTLLRRLNFDIVGLPPTPAEVIRFKRDWDEDADAAVTTKVDELLKRPQYGERWGRHWLDVARYAESSGSRNVAYPHAWRYRNYVIDSFNDDTPYNRFVTEQIAGDLLRAETDEQRQENLIATGFLAIGLKHHDEKNPRKFLADMVDEQIDTTTQAVLGLTVACARCHDHKYDPIPTADYYALAGIFQSTQTFYGTTRVAQNHRPSELLLLPIPDETFGTPVQSQQAIASLSTRIAELDKQAAGLRGKDRRQIRNSRNRLASQLAALNPDGSPKTFGMGVREAEQIVNANILLGGEVEKPAQEVPRGFVQVFDDLNFTVAGSESSGRLELAMALTSESNPLTARVMANRIWMHLMGKPLVKTPSNFGFSGIEPTNQKLLDYLAVRFMENGWSVKNLIREIVLSDAYSRSCRYSAENFAVDPENDFLWRANPRMIDAESLRDSMLMLSGRLQLERPEAIAAGPVRVANEQTQNLHRAVYLKIVRDQLPGALELFDFPDPNLTSSGRSESIVPTQALYLMNSDFVTSQARGMSERLLKYYNNRDEQVRAAFLWAYGRPPSADELKGSAQFFGEFDTAPAESTAKPGGGEALSRRNREERRPGRLGGGRRVGPDSRRTGTAAESTDSALAIFCQTLMASARFRILN